jgi:hypothetical protein
MSLYDYLPRFAELLLKQAALENPGEKDLEMTGRQVEEPVKRPLAHAAKTLGTGLLGSSVGYLGGYGATHLFNKYRPIDEKHVAPAVAALGGIGGLAYSLWKAKEQEELQRAVAAHRNQPAGAIPR